MMSIPSCIFGLGCVITIALSAHYLNNPVIWWAVIPIVVVLIVALVEEHR